MSFHPRVESLVDYTSAIEEPNREAIRRLLLEEGERIALSPGSTHNHQAWRGGYVDHMIGMIEAAKRLYKSSPVTLPFTLGDAILVILLHDIEKPWKYVDVPAGTQRIFHDEVEIKAFAEDIIQRFGFMLSGMHRNALKYAHGEGKDYRPDARVMNELAAFLHICDVWSARIEFNRRIILEVRS